MICNFTGLIKCRKPHGILGLCEHCKIPNSFGVFFATKNGKIISEQKFILEWQRRAQIAEIDRKINKLQAERVAVSGIASRDEYYRRE